MVRRDAVTLAPLNKNAPKRPWRKRVPIPPRPLAPLATPSALLGMPSAPRPPRPAADAAAAAARRVARKSKATLEAAAADFAVRQSLAERHAQAKPGATDPYERRSAMLARVRAQRAT